MHAIEIDHLTYSYPGAAHPALQDITVCVEQGDFLAIVGNNGLRKVHFLQGPKRSDPPVHQRRFFGARPCLRAGYPHERRGRPGPEGGVCIPGL